jgi:hypothetical protein
MRLRANQRRTDHWNRWGPYLSERAWGTVREDYSPSGTAWDYFPHDHARSQAYRWNEDGLAGICDRYQRICFAIALWNGRDPILKERLFGLTNREGNHGEDVKEYYFYLDNTPTHSYMKYLYKYPQAAFPYTNLVEENRRRNRMLYVKDAFHEFVVNGCQEAVNPAQRGTKAAVRYQLHVGAGQSTHVRLRLSDRLWAATDDPLGADFDQFLMRRQREADEFYATIIPDDLSGDAKNVMRQALAGLLWSKQFYHYELKRWLEGDPAQPPPPSQRLRGRNHQWTHLYNADVISMPDKWEFPWYASWDLAFQCVMLALVDPEFAKAQLTLILREWYMHPNGQILAYEWAFDDVNPPVHAWATLRVYQIEQRRWGVGDRVFLERVFHKLLLNFTWWVNRKDALGTNIFQGGFLGLDNIGLFDRSQALPPGVILGQSDGTSWMAMYCLNLLAIALELATHDPVYEDVASKFWEHFLYIANAMHQRGEGRISLWDEEDGFFYDVVRLPNGVQQPIKIRRSMGGRVGQGARATDQSGVGER